MLRFQALRPSEPASNGTNLNGKALTVNQARFQLHRSSPKRGAAQPVIRQKF